MTVFLGNDHTSLHSSVSSLRHSPWTAHACRGWALVSVYRHFSVSQEVMPGVNHSICVLLVVIVLLNINLHSCLIYLPLHKKIANKDLCIFFLLSSLVSWPLSQKSIPTTRCCHCCAWKQGSYWWSDVWCQVSSTHRCLQAPTSVSCAILLAIASFCPLYVPYRVSHLHKGYAQIMTLGFGFLSCLINQFGWAAIERPMIPIYLLFANNRGLPFNTILSSICHRQSSVIVRDFFLS